MEEKLGKIAMRVIGFTILGALVLVLADVVTHLTDLDGIPDGLDRLRTGAGGRTVAILDEAAAGVEN